MLYLNINKSFNIQKYKQNSVSNIFPQRKSLTNSRNQYQLINMG